MSEKKTTLSLSPFLSLSLSLPSLPPCVFCVSVRTVSAQEEERALRLLSVCEVPVSGRGTWLERCGCDGALLDVWSLMLMSRGCVCSFPQS